MGWIGYLLWIWLGASVVFTIIGIGFQSARYLGLAAVLSGVFSVAALFSIGIFILPICLAQATLAWRMRRVQHQAVQAPRGR